MSKLNVTWKKCGDDGHWCSFERVDLTNNTDTGVYAIWHGGEKPKVVYIGQGKVADRVGAHRSDRRITAFANLKLYVTWANVSTFQMNGVERYLANRYPPLVGDAHPNVLPIEVNGPWD
jgi:tricorn protease-like protein